MSAKQKSDFQGPTPISRKMEGSFAVGEARFETVVGSRGGGEGGDGGVGCSITSTHDGLTSSLKHDEDVRGVGGVASSRDGHEAQGGASGQGGAMGVSLDGLNNTFIDCSSSSEEDVSPTQLLVPEACQEGIGSAEMSAFSHNATVFGGGGITWGGQSTGGVSGCNDDNEDTLGRGALR